MLLHACGGFPGASRPFWGLQGLPGAFRGLQGPPGASRGLQEPPGVPKNVKHGFERKMQEAEISRGMVRLD